MSGFLSKIKARLEPGQHSTFKEPGWVRAALEENTDEQQEESEDAPPPPLLVDLVERMERVSLDSSPVEHAADAVSDRDNSSPQNASQEMWELDKFDSVLPDGFFSIIPHDNSKVRRPTLPSVAELRDADCAIWDVILVDPRRDKLLVRLKELCLEIVKEVDPNSADAIRRVAGMVADFYGGPLFETGYSKEISSDAGVTLLSQVKIGLCRPRALLFKYLADAIGLKSRLLMGLQLDSVPSTSLICSNPRRHLTNVVHLNGKELLVDVMRHPGLLRSFTVKALVMYHISGPGDSDSTEYDSCDSPLEPNSPLFFGPPESPSQSEPDVNNLLSRHNRRKSMSDDRGNKSSPELPSEVKYFQRRHNMVDGARSFPSSPEHPQARLRSFRPIKSQDGSNSSSPETGVRIRAPSILSGSRRLPDEERTTSTSSPDNSPQHENISVSNFRRRSSSFCVREAERITSSSSETRRVRKRTNAPEISDDVVRVVRAINEVVKQGKKASEQEAQARLEEAVSEPNSLKLCGSSSSTQSFSSDPARISRDFGKECGSSTSINELLPNHPIMPYTEWTINFTELRIGIRIGIGSFGEVFRATWRGTEVAVKVMLEQDLTRENTEDFFNEISLLSRLRHPNVILFMGACTSPPHLSMVTEYMHMGSLYRLIHMSGQGKKLSWRRRLKMLRDICRGMMCVQRMNIIHRDLKSANCLVDKHWCVKICDFGLSRLTTGTPIQETTAAGTPEWMAPELLRNEPVSYKCDIFSLGVIMWELCTLKKPWDGVQPLQVVHEVSVKRSRLEIPQGLLGKLIADCWQENPQERPSYDEILTRLHECEFLLG
ncbi:probable serine/threonine-protein kinase SIS8 isoform X2 [Selaginella moellendorffii]|uniref:probable serine/threonine-protein kinase SIS8 isoform X2 n=1 Tax=Selaginella moellendorffii TaxID=88036 RepID=UPI000D1C7D32|nr:probable serine/threonine-protein kinase SIS8 isoform X2 [Selaginella moellendorffii]|eukprot:XP_024544374.1 probable serine/threonine-protein kinase SIS8 isoform X2 [Selaginella moellendorffii]